MIISKDKVRN